MSRAPIESIDAVIGQRLRTLRTEMKVSQSKLGDDVGISFQQVQKYERGANRISASRLYKIASALGVNVNYFFTDFFVPANGATGMAEEGEPYKAPPSDAAIKEDAEAQALQQAFSRIRTPSVRASILDMTRAIAANQDDAK
ncbi:MAG: helix-turn-helix transcriptional regulator [Pseudomonadota bacterium]